MPKNKARRRRPLFPLLALALALALPVVGRDLAAFSWGDIGLTPDPPVTVPLAVCDASPGIFPNESNDPEALRWREIFRTKVDKLLENEMENKVIRCGGERSRTAEEILALLEAYGCALKAKGLILTNDLRAGARRQGKTLTVSDELFKTIEWFRRSESDLAVARSAVQRALLILVGKQKFEPLERSFVCLNRASRDLRNILGLLAEAASCLPLRTWDARGVLRVIEQPASSSASIPFSQ